MPAYYEANPTDCISAVGNREKRGKTRRAQARNASAVGEHRKMRGRGTFPFPYMGASKSNRLATRQNVQMRFRP